MNLRRLASDFYVADQITAADLPALADLGIRVLVNHRPAGEAADQPTGAELQAAAQAAGLSYREAPIATQDITEAELATARSVLEAVDGPVCAFCRSGARAAICWAQLQLGETCTQSIVDAVIGAGFRQLDIERRLGNRLLHRQGESPS